MIVIYWRNIALLGGPQSHSGYFPLGPGPALEDKENCEPAGFQTMPGMGLASVLNSGSRYTFVWVGLKPAFSGGISLYLHLQLAL